MATHCLPFGWKLSPTLCQRVLGAFVVFARVQDVAVLVYLDDAIVIGTGRVRMGARAAVGVNTLRRAGAVISLNSQLEPVQNHGWLGKDIDPHSGTSRTAGGASDASCAHSLWLAVGAMWTAEVGAIPGKGSVVV